MAKYDRQLIVAFLGGAEDEATAVQADALAAKQREEALPSEVLARVYRTGVILPQAGQPPGDVGRKVTWDEGEQDEGPAARKRPQSKVKLYWEGATQKWEWAY